MIGGKFVYKIRKFLCLLIAIFVLFSFSASVYAHSGRTDSNGGHWNTKTGTYHYHNGGSSSSSSGSTSGSTSTYQLPSTTLTPEKQAELNSREEQLTQNKNQLLAKLDELEKRIQQLNSDYLALKELIAELRIKYNVYVSFDDSYVMIPSFYKSTYTTVYFGSYSTTIDKSSEFLWDYSLDRIESNITVASKSITDDESKISTAESTLAEKKKKITEQLNASFVPENLKVHYIDVGQADSILIQTPLGKSILIDAGNNSDGEAVVNYLLSQGVKKLDLVIGTHPHEDHIGGLDTVIDKFDIGSIYMPKVSNNTNAFLDVLTSIQNKGSSVSTPIPNTTIDIDKYLEIQVLAPNSNEYEDLNNYSIVLKVIYKNTSYLFEGDAEDVSEKEILSKPSYLKADVIKVGHHGSSNSSTLGFLKVVSPKYAVISVGKGNTFGHPAIETLSRLASLNIQIYRTDGVGTIVSESDGDTIKFNKNASAIKPQAPPTQKTTITPQIIPVSPKTAPKVSTSQAITVSNPTVYITKTGSKYHNTGCRYLAKSKISIKLADAKTKGYGACSICKPPK